jgi:two-component system cell cycle sensor histidine kinase/response regulator CckA
LKIILTRPDRNPIPNDPQPEFVVEESVEELYEMAPCGYLTTTISGRIVKVNKTLIDWIGHDREALTGGTRFVDLLTVGGRIFFETHINLLLRMQSAVDEIALDMVCKDGTVLPVLINGRQKRDEAGEPVVNRFTIFNASERRMYERNLLAARDLLRVTLASIGDAVVTTDDQTRITFMNTVAEELTGWNTESAQGKPIDEVLILVRESDSVIIENPVIHALRTGTTAGMENHTVLVSREGRRIPVDDSASPIRDANNNVIGGVLVFRDISERKRNEALEREHQERIRETARLEGLGQMAAGIAHDFNNLLTGILGNASLLMESVAGTDLPKVHEILSSAERAASLTDQILAYSGKSWLEKKSVDLNGLVRESAGLIRASVRSHIELELVNTDITLEADPGQIRQIIVNLAINASEATPDGKGVVFIRTGVIEHLPSRFSPLAHALISSGRYALLEVRDNGTGISKDVQKRIFDPFFTTKFTGRGLGLSATLGIVKAHDGDIEVLSEPGKGSTFRIILPMATRVPQAPSRLPQPPRLVVPTNQTVLVVDDEEMIRKLASIALNAHGIRPLVAENGSEALAILDAEPGVSLVILDLAMPLMSGEEALPRIKEMRPDVPVIISSGFSETEILRRFESAGIASVISKPYTIPVFISKIANALRAHSSSGAGPSPE